MAFKSSPQLDDLPHYREVLTSLSKHCWWLPSGCHFRSFLATPPLHPINQCLESSYINSRPFRVNAGAVHAYVQVPGQRTGYLSEMCAGREVVVVDGYGNSRTSVVGRAKVEKRPMVSGMLGMHGCSITSTDGDGATDCGANRAMERCLYDAPQRGCGAMRCVNSLFARVVTLHNFIACQVST